MWWIRHTEAGYYANVVGVLCLMWWIRHTEAGYYANVVGYYACCSGYAIQRRGIMLTWWGIMLDVVDTPYGGGVLC